MHVIVIGAGIIGAAIALRLAQRGHRVSVIDSGAPGATAASFGWINASFHLTPEHYHLRAEGIAAWHRLTPLLGESVTWQGCLWWEELGPKLQAFAAQLQRLGYPVERRAPDLPMLAAPPGEALFFPAEGIAAPAATRDALLALATGQGAQVLRGMAVQAVETEAGRVTGIRTDAGRVAADHVVIAAGTGAPDLLHDLGLALPMLPRPGLMLRSSPVPVLDIPILCTPQGEVRQGADGCLWASAAVGHQADDATTIADAMDSAQTAAARIGALFQDPPARWDEVRLAWRPMPGDGLPVIGAADPQGLSVAVMHSGITLAAITAEILADEITTGARRNDLTPFRPERFLA